MAMDDVCTQVNSAYVQIDDTDRKAQLEDILAALNCKIEEPVEPTLQSRMSGGAGTTDPDKD